MVTRKNAAAGLALTAAMLLGGHAMAQGQVQVDNTGGWHATTICTLGVACAGTTLSFNIDIGHGLTNKIYNYSNGLTSIGHELTVPPVPLDSEGNPRTSYSYDIGDFAGQDYFTPYFDQTVTYQTDSGGSVHVFGNTISGGSVVTTHNFPNFDFVFQGGTSTSSPPYFGNGSPTYIEYVLTPIAGTHQGAFQVGFNYGDSHVQGLPLIYNYSGFSFGGDAGGRYFGRFDLGSTPLDTGGGVPEPAAWALMIAGFAGVGVALRTRRRAATAA